MVELPSDPNYHLMNASSEITQISAAADAFIVMACTAFLVILVFWLTASVSGDQLRRAIELMAK